MELIFTVFKQNLGVQTRHWDISSLPVSSTLMYQRDPQQSMKKGEQCLVELTCMQIQSPLVLFAFLPHKMKSVFRTVRRKAEEKKLCIMKLHWIGEVAELP